MRIQFQNIKYCEWIYLLPSITFHVKGWRYGDASTFRILFPKYNQGTQVLMHWLWFEILIETKDKQLNYGRKSRIS